MGRHHQTSFCNSQLAAPVEPRNSQAGGGKRILRRALCAALLLSFGIWLEPALASPTLVSAPDGTFQGKFDSTMREFLGVRYAQPLTPSLRWRPPQPLVPPVTTQDATQFGNHCPQPFSTFGNATMTEDCLFLNIYTPNNDRSDDPRPVMVWIHGGSLLFGAGNDYNPIKLVQRSVIVVTINYRLGALGFLAHPALRAEFPDQTSGNYGIADQQAALRWVQRNISAFGGDPTRVALGGQSAGAQDTGVNQISPLAAKLFNRAIYESSPLSGIAIRSIGLTRGMNFAAAAGCPGQDATTAACLRALSTAEILQLQGTPNVTGPFVTGPMLDGTIMPMTPVTAWRTGQFNRMPIMGGNVQDEATFGISITEYFANPQAPITAAQYATNVTASYSGTEYSGGPTYPAGTVAQVLAQYPSNFMGLTA